MLNDDLKHPNQVEQVEAILELVQTDDQGAALSAAEDLVAIIRLDNNDPILCRIETIVKKINSELFTETILSGITSAEANEYNKVNSLFFGIRHLSSEAAHMAVMDSEHNKYTES